MTSYVDVTEQELTAYSIALIRVSQRTYYDKQGNLRYRDNDEPVTGTSMFKRAYELLENPKYDESSYKLKFLYTKE